MYIPFAKHLPRTTPAVCKASMASILNPPVEGDASFALFSQDLLFFFELQNHLTRLMQQERSEILANLSRKACANKHRGITETWMRRRQSL